MSEEKSTAQETTLKEQVSAALAGTDTTAHPTDQVTVEAARAAEPIRQSATQRTSVRMLFVTTDTDVLTPGTPMQQHYADLAQFVGEVHIMVITTGRTQAKIERPMGNVWLYHVSGRHLYEQVWQARATARQHLRFNGVVQPDVIVATDPFVSGAAAWLIARSLRRPWQVHLRENIYTLEWLAKAKENKRQKRIARFVLRRARSVRVSTEQIKTALKTHVGAISDVALLPHLFNLSAYRQPPRSDVHEQYPQYTFIMLAEGELAAESTLHSVFAATHQLLKNSKVGLLIRGDGRAKALFTEKATLLGILEQVVFVGKETDAVPHYQTADVLVEAGTDADGDEHVLRAIAASTPVVAYRNDFRAGVIVDGESGFLCEPGDSYTLGMRIRTLLNDSARRKQFAMRAKNVAQDQLHEDVGTYYQAYRDTIASVIGQSDSAG
tara:strand:- start:603 stop:1916 length:1314 start_codon:yes stop_codon:yes gene_type:complete